VGSIRPAPEYLPAAARSSVTPVKEATLGIAAAGLALGALSFGWQLATFLLSGPRVRVRFRVGLRGPDGVIVGRPEAVLFGDQRKRLESEGYSEPVFAVTAVNPGRLPTTIESWGIAFGHGAYFQNPGGHALGPALPHRLEPHTSATWYAPGDIMRVIAEIDVGLGEGSAARMIRARVDTAAGSAVYSAQQIVPGREGKPRLRFPLRARVLARLRRKPAL